MLTRQAGHAVAAIVISTVALSAGQQPPRDTPPPKNPAVPRTGTGSISGQVVLSSGEPVSGAEVALSSMRGRSTTSTAADGSFEFTALPAGAYYLFATRQDLLTVRYGEVIYNRGGRTIPLADGERREFRLTLPRRSKIAGSVTDASGRPLANARVRAFKLMPPGLYGYPAANETASVITDTAGTYAFSSLDPANYAICASTAERSPVDSGTGYAVGCNPETADSPRKISLGPEDTRLDVNVTVAAAPLRRVEGTLNVPEGVAKPDLLFLKNVEEIYVDPALHLRPGADGAFRFNNVPPGHYVLSAWTGPENDRAAVMEKVVVEDADVTGLVLTMHRGSRVAGHLEFHRTLTPSAGAKQPRVMLSPAVPASRSVRWGSCQATTDGTGAFVFPSVQPGTYRLTAEYLQPQDWYMESVAGAEQPGRLVKVQTGQHVSDLVVKMTDYRAELTGTLVSERGMAGSEFMVVVYPADPGEWAPPFTFGRASLDGTFRFRLRRPGVYRVGVILDYDPAIRVGPDLLRDVDRKALTVSVADGDKKAVKLVVPAER